MSALPLALGDNLGSKPLSYIRHTLAQVIGLHVLKVFDCRRGKRNLCLFSHGIT